MGLCDSKFKLDNLPGHTPPENGYPGISPQMSGDDKGTSQNRGSQLAKYIQAYQEDNYRRLKHTFNSDMNLFLLNNTLMCVQFFDNFERSLMLAKDFKREKEKEVNDKLSTVVTEGVLAGKRKVTLLHGMGEILNQNYIYRNSTQEQADNETYNNLEAIFRAKSNNSSYMCEGILPMEFFINFENYKVYTASEWRKSEHNDYSSLIGDSEVIRLSMEEPDEKNQIPRGFARLHCEEVNRAEPLSSLAKGSNFAYDYSQTSEYFMDGASDTKSSIYNSTIPSDDDDDDNDYEDNMRFRNLNVNVREKMIPGRDRKVSKSAAPARFTASSNNSSSGSRITSPTESFTPKTFQAGVKKAKVKENGYPYNKETSIPEIRVHSISANSRTNDKKLNSKSTLFFEPRKDSTGLRPPSSPRSSRQEKDAEEIYAKTKGERESNTYPPPPAVQPMSNLKEYPSSGAISKASSVASGEILVQVRRRQLELKSLRDYLPKHKAPILPGRSPAQIPADCLIPVKMDKTEVDDFDHKDDTSEEDDDDTSSNSDGGESHATSLTHDSDYVTRHYLSSTQFAANTCRDFNLIGTKIGLEESHVNQAQVLGATIRCSVSQQPQNDEIENYNALHTFTPTVRSKHWSPTSELWFKQRVLPRSFTMESSQGGPEEIGWLSRSQVDSLIDYGCNMIPQGFRSIEFFNAHQSLEWQLNFCQAENFLLNTFKNAHWQTYIFSSILFRAFISPLGPKGIGLEHIRNIIYKMCEENFLSWNDEEPGTQLTKMLEKLYDSLGKGHLGNFFVDNYDMLRSNAPENTRLVQAILKRIRSNLINYCLHSFRNLTCLQDPDKFYPMADFKELYKLITSPDKDLLFILHPNFPMNDLDNNNNTDSRTGKKGKKKKKKKPQNDQWNDNMLQNVVHQYAGDSDRQQEKYRNKYAQLQKKKNIIQKEKIEKRRAEATIKNIIPQMEKRKSIDLDQPPVATFSNMRSVMVIEFYVRHFLRMASKALEFKSYPVATMYTLHVENLCRLMRKMELQATPIDIQKIDEYVRQAQQLKNLIGPKLGEYVKSTLPSLDLPDETSVTLLSLNSASPEGKHPMDNFFMNRKLPTPPRASSSKNSSIGGPRRFDSSAVGSSLFHFPQAPNPSPAHYVTSIHEDFEVLPEDPLFRPRRPNVKYLHEDLQHGFIPSATRFPRASFRDPPHPSSSLHQNAVI